MHEEFVILVNERDEAQGTMEKMEAHRKGLLHRAFSVFIFNELGEMLIHRRAESKYHSGGLWTNACCSHPRADETLEEAAHRRLMEEMGFDCDIMPQFRFTYEAKLDQGLTEHELDHVFFGTFNGDPQPNPDEVSAWKYVPMPALKSDILAHPDRYTEWFKIALQEIEQRALSFTP